MYRSEKALFLVCLFPIFNWDEPKGRGPDKSGLRRPTQLLCGAPRKDI